jgi:hypothetical protein
MRANSLAKVRDPERRAKIAAAKRGKPRPPEVLEASETHKRRWANDPRRWTAEEDAMILKLTATEVAKRTGRTVAAVKNRRVRLGLPDGRTKAARLARATASQ